MPLLWISLAFLTGVLLGELPGWSTATWLGLAGLTLGSGLILQLLRARFPSRSPRFDALRFFFLAAALCLGGARFQAAQPDWTDPGFIHNFIDTEQELVVTGVLVAPPDELDAGANLRVKVESLHPAGELSRTPVHGLLLARTRELGDWRYGDRLVLRGYLTEPFENEEFSYREYLARQGVYAYMGGAEAAYLERAEANPMLGALYALRDRAHALVYRYWPDPEASLMSGILLGIERGIPASVQKAFKDTGTSHIIAISGFNITLVAGLLVTLFGRALGPRRGAALAALGIGAYTILVGADAAVVRAALMGGLSLLAQQLSLTPTG